MKSSRFIVRGPPLACLADFASSAFSAHSMWSTYI
jgi:hypothetical protein